MKKWNIRNNGRPDVVQFLEGQMTASDVRKRWQHVRLNENYKGQQTCPLSSQASSYIYIHTYIYLLYFDASDT